MDQLIAALDRLRDSEPLPESDWDELSALSDERMTAFRGLWDDVSAAERLDLLDSLHTETETHAHLDFTPIWALALADPAPRVRLAGIQYSEDEHGDWLLDPLLIMVERDPDAAVRAAAADALGRFAYLAEVGDLSWRRASQLQRTLLAVYGKTDEPLAVRGNALASVGYFSTPDVRAAIVAGHADDDLKPSAVLAMGRNCDPGWTETLLADTRGRGAALREAAVRSIGEIEDSRGVPRLLELLEDPAVGVRVAAIWALGEIGGDEAQEALVYCLQDDNEPVREAAERALEELASRDDPLGL